MNMEMAVQVAPTLDLGGLSARPLAPGLGAVLEGGFEEIQGCVVLSYCAECTRQTSVEDEGDSTGFEAVVNQLHVEDLLRDLPQQVPTQATLFVAHLARALERAYPADAFDVIYSVNDDAHTVRFHKTRPGPGWLGEDIESYEDAALSVRTGDDCLSM